MIKEKKMKVIAFNGSARKKGNTSILLQAVLNEIKQEGIETELISLAGTNIQGCIACYKCYKNKDGKCGQIENGKLINEFVEKMRAADGIILGSPTYFSDVTANMKAVIERCGMVARANGDILQRKVGASVVAVRRAGSAHVFSSLNYFFLIGQMIVCGSNYWNIGMGKDPGDVENDTEGMLTMATLGKNMAWLLNKLHSTDT